MLLNLIVIMIFGIEDDYISCKNWLREVKVNVKCIIVINMYF